jgi:23S rRNA (uracil1939-C5)-methyltransferase
MSNNVVLNKNDIIDAKIIDLTHEGLGVAKINGFPVFVHNALVGEKAKIKITKVGKSFSYGRIVEMHEESPHRTEPVCDIYKQCGGCQSQHMSYEAQLIAKQKQVQDVIERIGKIKDVKVHPVLGMEKPWNYRNKAQVPAGVVDGVFEFGFYQQRSHSIIPMEQCYIQHEQNDKIIQFIKGLARQYGIMPYDEPKHRGVLRHVMVRYAKHTGEVMVVFITKGNDLPFKSELIDAITNEFSNIKSIVQNVNAQKTNVIFGEKTVVLWGSEYIYDYIGDVKFAISARSFYQVNPDQTAVLYGKALEYAGLTGDETVIDAYCGVGTISLFLAKVAKKVYGVEIVEAAIEDARRNAELNRIENVEFAVGKSEEEIPAWKDQGIVADVIVVDPPRKGCDEELLRTIIEMKPKRVVYVSCNPGTMARDLKILEDGGFKTVEVQPVDMFPQTMHCEVVVKMVLKEGK